MEWARRLGAGVLVEGYVFRHPAGFEVKVGLAEVQKSHILTSDSFRGRADDPLSLVRTITARMADILSLSLSSKERARIARNPTESFRAYDAFAKGMGLLRTATDRTGFEPAMMEFRGAIEQDPGFAEAHAGLSEALWREYERSGDPSALTEAEAEVRLALAIDPDLPAGLVALARVYRGLGRPEKSIEEIRRVLERHPRPEQAYRELGLGYERAGDREAAENSFREAVAAAPSDWFPSNALGNFLWRVGDYEGAKEALERAAALAPAAVTSPRESRAGVLSSMGRFEEALAAYEDVVALYQRESTAIGSAVLASNIGTAYYFSNRLDRLEQAERYYRLASELNPHDEEVQHNLGDVLVTLGRAAEALPHYREALRLVTASLRDDPENPELLLRQAFYSAKLGDCEAAVPLARSVAAVLPSMEQAAHTLAYAFALCREREAALAALRLAIAYGASAELLRIEDEFAWLRDDPDFEALLAPPSPATPAP